MSETEYIVTKVSDDVIENLFLLRGTAPSTRVGNFKGSRVKEGVLSM